MNNCPKCNASLDEYDSKDTNPDLDEFIAIREVSINCIICGFMHEAEYNYTETGEWQDEKEVMEWVVNYEEIKEPNKNKINYYIRYAEMYNLVKSIQKLSVYVDDFEKAAQSWDNVKHMSAGGEEHGIIGELFT